MQMPQVLLAAALLHTKIDSTLYVANTVFSMYVTCYSGCEICDSAVWCTPAARSVYAGLSSTMYAANFDSGQ